MGAKHILTCVTGQRSCERLIAQGTSFAQTLGCDGTVLHVASSQNLIMGSENRAQALEHLYQISKDYGADMAVLRADDPVGGQQGQRRAARALPEQKTHGGRFEHDEVGQ